MSRRAARIAGASFPHLACQGGCVTPTGHPPLLFNSRAICSPNGASLAAMATRTRVPAGLGVPL
ncbi:MAG: hypothetical protein ICV73_22150 [Acetobacteraceae bacterium]|nr:hypothetical protein [Acetobacteraceae bacterium]